MICFSLVFPFSRFQKRPVVISLSLLGCQITSIWLPPADVATSLNNLAELYHAMGKYDNALPLYEQALNMRKKLSDGKPHPDVATSLNNLAGLYREVGKYDKALPLLQQALEMKGKLLDEDHPSVVVALNNIAGLYLLMREYDKALLLFQQVLEINRKRFNGDHPSLARSLNNLAGVSLLMGERSKALPLFQQALEMSHRLFPQGHPDAATYLEGLAGLYREAGEYRAALPLFQQALEMKKRLFNEEHPSVATSLENLAGLYSDVGEYGTALALYRQALELKRKFFGEQHPDVAASLLNLALLYVAIDELEHALKALKEAAEITEHQYRTLLPILTEKEMLSFVSPLVFSPNLCLLHPSAEVKEFALEQVLRNKGRVLNVLSQQRKLQQIDDAVLAKKLQRLQKLQDELSRHIFLGSADFSSPAALHQLNAAREQLEAEIALRIQELTPVPEAVGLNLDEVGKAIPAKHALVEFVQFNQFHFRAIPANGEKRWGEPRYLAFVLHHGRSEPEIVDLGSAEMIENQFRIFMKKVKDRERLVSLREEGERLRKLVFDPLLPMLNGTENLILSPDGKLNLLTFNILPDDEGGFLVDKYHFHYVSSGRELLEWRTSAETKTSAPSIFTDPDFDLSSRLQEISLQPVALPQNPIAPDDRGFSFRRLPGTEQEADAIIRIWLTHGRPVTVYRRADASEERLKREKSPFSLHLATHGFFLEDIEPGKPEDTRGVLLLPNRGGEDSTLVISTRQTTQRLEDPMLQSGIALAGANAQMRDNLEDGIVTALEISQLDLQGTKLVVLSACETGLGEVKVGQGVYGLRRAFQLAGAQTVIASLWSVSDRETAELMTVFYQHWLSGETKSTALRESVLALRQREPHPYYWGAFISLGKM